MNPQLQVRRGQRAVSARENRLNGWGARAFCLGSLLAVGTCGLLVAEDPPPGKVLRVATKNSPPFSMKDSKGTWTGLSVDLWRKIARDLELEYEFVEADLAPMVQGLSDGSLDVAVAALTITFEREQSFDFTHAFYSSGLGIAISAEAETSWTGAITRLFNWQVMKVFLSVVAVLMVGGLAIWLLERKRNPQHFGGGIWKGIGAGCWWSVVTGTTVGYGDKVPVTPLGRVLAVIWMFSSVLILSAFTGALASLFTVSQLRSLVAGPEDLPNVAVGTVEDSTSERFLDENGMAALSFATAEVALTHLRDGLVDAVVYDTPILRHVITSKNFVGLHVLPHILQQQVYAMGLASESPRREAINRFLLKRTSEPAWRELVVRYLGAEP